MRNLDNVRPLIWLRTPLGKVPTYWLKVIEPKITRTEDSPCWFWDGALNNEGEPYVMALNPLTGRRRPVMLKRIIAEMFWVIKKTTQILHGCENKNCLNPRHFYITNTHWRHENRDKIIKAFAARIRRWGKDKE